MYPLVRMVGALLRTRNAEPLPVTGEHHSAHICLPWDIDPWLEMNNGRILTLNDLSRIVLFRRLGVVDAMRRERWAGTIAGASIRFRRRVRAFQRFETRSRIVGWDERFIYCEQSAWRAGDCTSHVLLRMAMTSREGIVPPARLAAVLGIDAQSPPIPDWIAAWIAAEAQRPWPPMTDTPVPSPGATNAPAGISQDADIEARRVAR